MSDADKVITNEVDTTTDEVDTSLDKVAAEVDWREQFGGGEKGMKQLQRFESAPKFLEAYLEAQKTISSTRKDKLPENPTEAELGKWRKANDIPQTADEYSLDFGDGVVLGDADEAFVRSMLPALHAQNISQSSATALISEQLKQQALFIEQVHDQDVANRDAASQVLKEAWGDDFKANQNIVEGVINQIPEAVRDLVLGARLGDNTKLLDSADVVMWLANMGQRMNPSGTILNEGNRASPDKDRIKELKSMMGNKYSDYWQDPSIQEEYRTLLDRQA